VAGLRRSSLRPALLSLYDHNAGRARRSSLRPALLSLYDHSADLA